MTIYDLTEAIKRHSRLLIIGFSLLVFVILLAVFTIKDGSIAWRSSPTYEASIQIAVVSPDTTSLTTVNTSNDALRQAAALYSTLLKTDEAAVAVGTATGYKLTDPISASVDDRAAVITVTVVGPTPDLAVGGAEEAFSWLVERLREPLLTADTTGSVAQAPDTPLVLSGPFDSSTVIAFDEALGSVNSNLFLQVTNDLELPTTLPVASNAGEAVITRSTLSPTVSLLFKLQDSDDVVQDTLRISPPQLPRVVDAVPILTVALNEGAIIRDRSDDGDGTWSLVGSQIELTWTERAVASDADDQSGTAIEVEIVALTAELGVVPIGGRRGPITAVGAFLVGALLLLSLVIVADGWSRARDTALEGSAAPDAALPSASEIDDEVEAPLSQTLHQTDGSPSPAPPDADAPPSQTLHHARTTPQDRDMARKP